MDVVATISVISLLRGLPEMLDVHFFASIREAMNTDQLQIAPPDGVQSVRDLMQYLAETQPGFGELTAGKAPLLVAVNQTVVGLDTPVEAGDEIAFFPPMTGG